ncbi:MAG: hypothetical protein RLZZ207_671, partial [Bacteroidota bacterium]
LSAHEVIELKLIESEQVSDLEAEVGEEQDEETPIQVESTSEESEANLSDDLEVGSTLTLTPKKGEDEQLGLF